MWISLKKWNEWRRLEELASFLKQIEEDRKTIGSYGNVTLMHDIEYTRMIVKQSTLEKQAKDADTYKQLYLNELQKRLELADRVRELEGE